MSPRARAQDALRYAKDLARFGLVPGASLLPSSLAYRLALSAGERAYQRDPWSHPETGQILQEILGDHYSPAARRRFACEYERQQKCEAMDRLRIAGDRRNVRRLMAITGAEHVRSALSDGRGVIVCVGHYGSAFATVARLAEEGFPLILLRRSMDIYPEYAEKTAPGRAYQRMLLQRTIDRFLQGTIIVGEDQFAAGVQIAKRLRANEVIVSFIDAPALLDERDKAVLVPFLGLETPFMAGNFAIAHRLRTPILVAVAHRSPDYAHLTLDIHPPIMPDAKPEVTLGRCLAVLEEAIRAHPEQWTYLPLAGSHERPEAPSATASGAKPPSPLIRH
jgi:lauroyl/myristoyl acyltransferase